MRDPGDAIRDGENALRALIEETLEREFGPAWLDESGLSKERIAQIHARQAEEERRRPLQAPEDRPLFYAEIFDLKTIIDRQWELLRPALLDKKETDVFLEKLEDLRNPDAHQRALWPYEVDLVYGISGHFRQALALSRMGVDDADRYYARFERIVDNLGNSIVYPSLQAFGKQAVHPGTELTYRIEAWNPDPDPLQFSAKVWNTTVCPLTTETLLRFVLAPEHIRRHLLVDLYMHRHGSRDQWDDHAVFVYTGIPS